MSPSADRRAIAGYAMIGFALGGFFDGILLHQILQWHHLLSAIDGPAAGDLRFQMVADGVFHLAMYVIALIGAGLLVAARRARSPGLSLRRMAALVLAGFGTWPTGELFSVLARHSILRHSLGETPAPVLADDPVFRHWCGTALGEGGDFASRLFSIRAAGLLHDLKPEQAAACLSGLLIGAEIASATRRYDAGGEPVTLIASGALGVLYGAALGLAGLEIRPVDADEAVRAGLFSAARHNGMVAEGTAA